MKQSLPHSKPKVIFVAGLGPNAQGQTGGQVAAASTLFCSPLAQKLNFIPLSSTMVSIPPPALPVRAWNALKRLTIFVSKLPQADATLIFTSDSASVIEKGSMVLLAHWMGKACVLRFSSGAVEQQTRSPAFRWWIRKVCNAADVVCVQGPYWADFFATLCREDVSIRIIPNGVTIPPAKDWSTDTSKRSDLRIIFVGWLYREKGIFEMLQVIQELKSKFPALKLSVAGGGRDEQEFRHEITNKGLENTVEVLGWVTKPRLAELLPSCDAFFLPTHYEGLPNAMLEAMAVGLPVVVSRVGSIPDFVQDDVNGLLVEPKNTQQMVIAMTSLLSDHSRRRTLGEAARNTIQSTFGIDVIWPIFHQTICDAIDHAQARRMHSR